jgi:hypothetical protein
VAAVAVNRIAAKLVPTAFAGEKENARVNNGTTIMPPPTPVMDANMPTKKPRIGRINSHILAFSPTFYMLSVCRIMLNSAIKHTTYVK